MTTQTDELNNRFATQYVEHLRYRDVPHSKIMLTFSGIPGSGKTMLARKLADDLRVQYVQHDQIRDMIRRDGYDPSTMSMIPISHLIIDKIMLEDRNKFVILDASIDRSWPVFFEHTKEWNIHPIIIRLNVPYDILKSRLQQRDTPQAASLKHFDSFTAQFESCRAEVRADFELTTDYNYSKLLSDIRIIIK